MGIAEEVKCLFLVQQLLLDAQNKRKYSQAQQMSQLWPRSTATTSLESLVRTWQIHTSAAAAAAADVNIPCKVGDFVNVWRNKLWEFRCSISHHLQSITSHPRSLKDWKTPIKHCQKLGFLNGHPLFKSRTKCFGVQLTQVSSSLQHSFVHSSMNFFWGFFMVIHLQNLSIRAYTKGFCS